jgi:hypothetical protein
VGGSSQHLLQNPQNECTVKYIIDKTNMSKMLPFVDERNLYCADNTLN